MNTIEEEFFKDIQSNGGIQTLLIYADWLEEQNRYKESEYVRKRAKNYAHSYMFYAATTSGLCIHSYLLCNGYGYGYTITLVHSNKCVGLGAGHNAHRHSNELYNIGVGNAYGWSGYHLHANSPPSGRSALLRAQ